MSPRELLVMFVWLALSLLSPGRDHRETRDAIVDEVSAARPLFEDDALRLRTAALVVAIAFRESSFRNDAVSSTGDACLMQIHGRPELTEDAHACVRVGLEMVRASMRACGAGNVLGVYASGLRGCTNARAVRISRDRMRLAGLLLGGGR